LAHDFPPLGGGIARWLGELAARTDLVVSTGSVPDADDQRFGGRVDRVGIAASRLKNPAGMLAWRTRIARLVRDHRPGFIWVGNVRPAGPLAAWIHDRDRIPYGIIVYGGDLLQLRAKGRRHPLRRRVHRWVVDRAAVIVAISGWTAALAREVFEESGAGVSGKIEIVPLGSDPTRFHPDVPASPLRVKYSLPDRRWLLTVARLVPHKGVDVGIEVVARLAPSHPELGYLVVGTGPDRDRLRRAAAAAGVAERVIFLEGVPDEDIPGLATLATLYLGLSREEGHDAEGFGIALVDAAAAGLAVVAGRSGGTADAVRDGETGILVPPTDSGAVAGEVARLLADPERRGALGAAGRCWVERDRNWDRVTRDLLDLSRRAATAARR